MCRVGGNFTRKCREPKFKHFPGGMPPEPPRRCYHFCLMVLTPLQTLQMSWLTVDLPMIEKYILRCLGIIRQLWRHVMSNTQLEHQHWCCGPQHCSIVLCQLPISNKFWLSQDINNVSIHFLLVHALKPYLTTCLQILI